MKIEESALKKESLLYEGKAKKLYKTNLKNLLWMEYKDDATAFNGEKKESLKGKGRLNNEITSLVFERLEASGLESHFVKKISSTEQLVRETAIIPLEVVVRNVVAGSLQRRTGLHEGMELEEPVIEFYYKDDALGDPLVNEDHIRLLQVAEPEQLHTLKRQALAINTQLSRLFRQCGLILVDLKLEFGKTADNEIILADEVSPDTCRLWDAATKEKLDKDIFRYELGSLQEAYEDILNRLGGAARG
ncbi:phosphoribosylaminoimidazolesuccinocarboxamide synthase [Alteribacillus iranensis]|uniref:Phosphoribosylaminoimidazole-succinocarboxamide synthase n=1 Tax=Alteribacillus iranensis TaxID=930128 RepID=A0A1I2E831_9BACI|nr:phosphoribosylaminoimidazolesuccinocarboxamide synthase [Alteribacillus iranensis]SFE88995.1 phosphoribosylaminoimidazole-succinocarboxamide synthase [Alteribacillus iranensis]